jgi:hypothetical protein
LGRTRSKSEVRGKRVRGVTRVELVRAPATFEWPPHHRAYLEELLPSVTKILIIGWQAKEAHFLQMLRERLPMGGRRVAHILVVGKNSADAKADTPLLRERARAIWIQSTPLLRQRRLQSVCRQPGRRSLPPSLIISHKTR